MSCSFEEGKGCQNALALTRVEQLLRVVRVLPISGTASRVAYHLMQRFYLSHSLLIPDALIAATALDYGVTLYTKNVRHFLMIPGLTVVCPY
jgi:predicted nucleic acid-binding protein